MTSTPLIKKYTFGTFTDTGGFLKDGEDPNNRPLFTAEDLKKSRQQGYDSGLQEASKKIQESLEKVTLDLVEQIQAQIPSLMEQIKINEQQLVARSLELTRAIVYKIFHQKMQEASLAEAEEALKYCLSSWGKLPKLRMGLAGAIYEKALPRLQEIFTTLAGDGNFDLVSDETLSPPDCWIQWDQGSLRVDIEALWASLDGVISGFHKVVESSLEEETSPDLLPAENSEKIEAVQESQKILNSKEDTLLGEDPKETPEFLEDSLDSVEKMASSEDVSLNNNNINNE